MNELPRHRLLPPPSTLEICARKTCNTVQQSKTNHLQAHQCKEICGEPETFTHLLQCDDPVSQAFQDNLLEHADDFFTNKETPHTFQQLFFTSCQWWLDPPSTQTRPTLSQQCFLEQEEIGWALLPRGCYQLHGENFTPQLTTTTTTQQ